MKYKTLLFDVDGTLLNFDVSAEKSLERLFAERNYPFDDGIFPLYTRINNGLWERYERGEMPRDRVLVDRFTLMFEELGIGEKGETFENDFRVQLEKNPVWMEGAEPLLQYLKPKYDLYIVTNGVASTQRSRLAATGLDTYVRDVFISDVIGAQKPTKAFFDYCFDHITPCLPSEILLIGDSLSADILGANRAGIDSCWFNPAGKKNTSQAEPTMVIARLDELYDIL